MNDKSIPARVLIGDINEVQGDLKGALASYQAALGEFDRQYPDSYESPQYLIMKISELMVKVKVQPLKVDHPSEQ